MSQGKELDDRVWIAGKSGCKQNRFFHQKDRGRYKGVDPRQKGGPKSGKDRYVGRAEPATKKNSLMCTAERWEDKSLGRAEVKGKQISDLIYLNVKTSGQGKTQLSGDHRG